MQQLQQMGEELAQLRAKLAAAQATIALLEGGLIEIRRRDLRYYGTIETEQWAYDGPIGEFVTVLLEKAQTDAQSAQSSL